MKYSFERIYASPYGFPMVLSPETLLRALADETRLRCLLLLHAEGELCVCELTAALDVIQPKVSRHLATLRETGVVQDRRQGHWVHYRIRDDLPAWGQQMLGALASGAAQREPYAGDRRRLAEMAGRPGGRVCA
jgi:ArsR family transcriptional regulator